MFQPIDREAVVRILKLHGPLLPLEIRKYLGTGDSTLIGATLSELAHHGRVAISKVKRGGSPFYYDPQNPASLEKVWQDLGEKERRAFQLLKERRVINPDEVDPLTRVCLANIPDYAKPMKVAHEGQDLLFYRYFLVSEQEGQQRAHALLSPAAAPVPAAAVAPVPSSASSSVSSPAPATASAPTPVARTPPVTPPAAPRQQPVLQPAPRHLPAEQQQTLERPVPVPRDHKAASPPKATVQQTPEAKPVKNAVVADDEFLKRIVQFCDAKGLVILEHIIVRKKAEVDLVLQVPTPVGTVEYFCKAKSKRKSNDGDVAGALLAAQQRRLPAIYLTTGEVTKKAKELTQTQLKGVLIKEIKP